jgi:hypothetical protein
VFPPQSVLDLLIPGQSPGIKERLVDLYNKPEILFFGPDGAPICFSNILGVYTSVLCRGDSRHDGLGSSYVLVLLIQGGGTEYL